jgi:hypothetical protein
VTEIHLYRPFTELANDAMAAVPCARRFILCSPLLTSLVLMLNEKPDVVGVWESALRDCSGAHVQSKLIRKQTKPPRRNDLA